MATTEALPSSIVEKIVGFYLSCFAVSAIAFTAGALFPISIVSQQDLFWLFVSLDTGGCSVLVRIISTTALGSNLSNTNFES